MNPVPLTWRLLTAEELTKVYLDEMRRDFPQSELKPLSMILNSEAAGTPGAAPPRPASPTTAGSRSCGTSPSG